jgi:hypothetical protein
VRTSFDTEKCFLKKDNFSVDPDWCDAQIVAFISVMATPLGPFSAKCKTRLSFFDGSATKNSIQNSAFFCASKSIGGEKSPEASATRLFALRAARQTTTDTPSIP